MRMPGKMVMVMEAFADGRRFHPGVFLKSFDFNANNGSGSWEFTRHIEEAMKFSNVEAGLRYWNTVCPSRPVRVDGKPNKPLTMFTISLISAEGATFWNNLVNNPTGLH